MTDTTKSASAVINITGPPLADGNYVFSVSGRDAISGGAPYSVAGAFTIAGGVITGGEQDFGDAGTIVSDLINSTGNNISATSDGNLQIVLNICNGTDCTTADTSVGVNGVETFNGTLYCNCTALITEFDSSATAGGVLDLQTNPSAPSGGYAFALGGIDSGASTVVIGGILNIDSPGGISGAGSVFDINDAGLAAPLQAQTFDASTVSALDSFGRVTITLNPSVASGIAQIVLVGYVADSKHIRLVETSDNFGGTTGGTALGQGPNTGLITTIAGNSYVVGVSGQETAGGVLQAAGLLTANSDGTLSGTVNYNDLTGVGTQVPISITGGAYTIDPTGTGYVTMTGVTDGTANFNLQLYLTGDGHALAATMDTNDALVGLGFGQVGVGNFTAGSFSGKYAMGVGGVDSVSENEFDAAGPITADGVSAFSGTADLNQLFGATSPDLTVSGTFTADPSGIFTGTMTGVDVTTNTNTDNFVYYLIDNQRGDLDRGRSQPANAGILPARAVDPPLA